MPLKSGDALGPYIVVSALGAGGMGEVYRARDNRLNRDVAIKVLPDAFARDAERLMRFEREAQVLAALSHPNIAAIYGIEEQGSTRALVMELVEGRDLSELTRGMALADALSIARQVIDALEAAHEQGIVHRDLKPANIKVRSDGTVKVLDFGLARTSAATPADADSQATMISPAMTQMGVILGTATYMAPEQAKGKPVDKRADIWAFGCIVFEMLTGHPPFAGETITDVIAAAVTKEPDWSALPPAVPARVRRLLARCLQKDPRARLRDIGDARYELSDEALSSPVITTAGNSTSAMRTALLMLTVAVVVASAVWVLKPASAMSDRAAEAIRLSLTPDQPLTEATTACPTSQCAGDLVVAISPDGTRLVYAAGRDTERVLYERRLDQFESRVIPGTEGGLSPAFSPDGRNIAFVASRKLKRVSLDGGAPMVLWQLPSEAGDGVSWSDDGTILVGSGIAAGIWRIPENGGGADQITVTSGSETLHRTPEALPGGKVLLFSVVNGMTSEEIFAQSLVTGERKRLVRGINPHFIAGNRLAWVQDDTLFTAGFDPSRLEIQGSPTPVVQGIRHGFLGSAQYGLSKTGSIVFVPANDSPRARSLVWVDRSGVETAVGVADQAYLQPRVSPDGQRIGVVIGDGTEDVWTYEIERHTWTRVTSDERSVLPLWSPDGRRLAFASARTGAHNIYVRPTDGSGQDTRVTVSDRITFPISWSSLGILAFVRIEVATATDIWTTPLDPAPSPTVLVQTKFREGAPTFSPDGKWMAYVTDESGRPEVYVRAFPGQGERRTLSTQGGNEPMWSRDGKHLFYRSGEAMMSVAVTTLPTFSSGVPQKLFSGPYERSTAFWSNYDASPDGSRLLMVKRIKRAPLPQQINIVINGLSPKR